MENEMIREAMEEVAEEIIPAAQDIVEEAIAPAAQAIVQDIPVIEPVTIKAEPKHSGWKTVLLVSSLATIALIKPAKKAWNNHKEKQAAKRREEFNRLYDERRAQELAEAQAASETTNATNEQISDSDEASNEE